MIIPKFFADWLIRRSKRTPYFHLGNPESPYMERYWLWRPAGHGQHTDTSDVKQTGWGARIHRIMRSDDDRALHDHPWANCSIILRGGYYELTEAGMVWRGVGSVVFRKATDKHRLIVPQGGEAWTLFIMGPWQRTWGFHTPDGWVEWRKYLRI